MRFISILLLVFIFNSSIAQIQKFNWKNHVIKNDSDLLKTTTWIYASSPKKSVFGTGFFFFSKKTNELYLITNRHIVEGYSNLSFGYHSVIRADSLFGIDSLQYRTKYSKNKSVDLAAIRLDTIRYLDLKTFNYFKVFTEDNLMSRTDSSSISIFDNKIIALSFPGLTSVPLPFQPYIIHCNLSLPFNFKFQNSDDLVIDGNLTSGCSGSPIIFIRSETRGKRYSLLGTFYFSFANYHSIDSVANDTTKDYKFKPIIDTPYIVNGEKQIIKGYKVNQSLNIGLAIKTNYLMELINNH